MYGVHLVQLNSKLKLDLTLARAKHKTLNIGCGTGQVCLCDSITDKRQLFQMLFYLD